MSNLNELVERYVTRPAGHASLPESDLPHRGSTRGRLHRTRLGSVNLHGGEYLAELHAKVRDTERCHFDEGALPMVIRLHFVREDVISA